MLKKINFLLLALVFAIPIIIAYDIGQANGQPEQKQGSIIERKPTLTITKSPTPVDTRGYVDSDPIVDCGPGQNSGQYVKDKKSNCGNYVDCGFQDGSWRMMLKSECDAKHALESSSNNTNNEKSYPGCTINYSQLGAITYYDIPTEDCATRQMNARLHDIQTENHIKCIQNYGGENCPTPSY